MSRAMVRALMALLLVLAPGADAWARPKKKERPKVEEKVEPKEAPPAKPADSAAPVITHIRVQRAQSGQPIVIRARIEDESEIFAPSVSVRPEGRKDYDSIPMKRGDDGWEAVIPAEQVTGNVEYFIEAFDEQGNGPTREGTPERPILVTVGSGAVPPDPKDRKELIEQPPPPPPPGGADEGGIASKWWFWTILGVAVTGGVVGGVIALQGSGRVDAVDIEVRGPNPAGNL